jgi:UDP-GlcNAc:undecaprenyl-phosphate GlcNAc-1-phosphate transferase
MMPLGMVLYSLVTALAISMALIPLMMRIAPRLGMIDKPDPRKVHARPVPRVGGIGIVCGALASILLWGAEQSWAVGYLAGSAILLVAGALDDSLELGHYPKFVAQIAAAAIVAYAGDLWVSVLPFVGEVGPGFGKPFTVFALVGVINAINHSDGLDGLAGGESLLSLGCLAWLGYVAGASAFVLVAAAVAGGLIGFLRYNTHPARVFMGDAGSQFLGFSLGVLAVALTQRYHPGLSMALPLLVIGLPIVDILAVLGQRIYHRMNWFRATRNHIHHRLLALGFEHHQAVMMIYAVQAALVAAAVAARYESDALVAGIYAAACAAVFALLLAAERAGWRRAQAAPRYGEAGTRHALLRGLPLKLVEVALPAFLLIVCIGAARVPADLGRWAVTGLAALTGASLLLDHFGFNAALSRVSLYVGTALAAFIAERNGGLFGAVHEWIDDAFFVALALAIAAALRFDPRVEFRTTPLDLLLVIAVIGVGVGGGLAGAAPGAALGTFIFKLATLFYGCELVVTSRAGHQQERLLRGSVLAAALIVMARGFM